MFEISEPFVVPRLPSWDGTSIPRTNESPRAAPGTTTKQISITSASLKDDLTQSLAAKRQDIDRYIALGCLHFQKSLLPSHESQADTKWMELLYHELPEEVKSIIGDEASRLLEAHWIRLFLHNFAPGTAPFQSSVRVYLMPEDWGRRSIDRNSKKLKATLRQLLKSIDISTKAWHGDPDEKETHYFDPWAEAELSSLYYLFNKLPSPSPDPGEIKDRYTRAAVNDLLESATASGWEEYGEQSLPGLRTRLYAYQARSASAMLQREAAPQLQLDPRLEVRSSPDGRKFYFGSRDGSFLHEPRYYETTRGGILAETMGLGKTVICLAVILASKHHLPKIPVAYRPPPPVRRHVGTLSDVAASILGRYSVPARGFLEQSETNGAGDMTKYRNALDRNIPFYEIPAELSRINRSVRIPLSRQLIISSGTIVVVPRNLLHQWQSEIKKHVLQGGLRVLVLDTVTKRGSKVQSNLYDNDNMQFRSELPVPTELMKFDVLLFTRNRFEQEIQDGQDDQGRRAVRGVTRACNCPYIGASRIPDCNCVDYDKFYESPLKKVHWLRIIIDEGHSFSSSLSNAVLVAKQIEAERRWVVSGTPAKNLVGVEVDMATMETESDTGLQRELAIEQRKSFNLDPDNLKAAKALGVLASNFLMARPWCDSSEGKLDWEEHIYRHEHRYRKTYSGFSSCFLRTLEGLVVKTRPEDVERDIILPPMRHRIVFLKPCWYDKMTANLFVQVLRANAITSERTDVDYLFHKNSVKERHALIRNLRQSYFTWTGFSLLDIIATIETSSKYLAKEGINCSIKDSRALLESCQVVSKLTTSEGWKALSNAHEVGIAVKDWPKESRSTFALGDSAEPTMIGITQLIEGQLHVDGNLLSHDPAVGLEAVGCEAKAKVVAMAEAEGRDQDSDEKIMADSPSNKAGVPLSLIDGHQSPTSRRNLVTAGTLSSQRQSENSSHDNASGVTVVTSSLRSKKRKLTLADETANLPTSSPLHDTHIVGTTSAKLSYLLDKVMQHQATEKIIIFYDGDNAAWYIAQCLELMYVNHRIYARNLDNTLRSEYVRLFTEDPDVRVLMIDVACGALGLNLNAASIVLILNPINRPNIEAQAIKRAHRIGQTKEVLVETLVLENTIEHSIFNRAKKMTRADHQEAKELEDDVGIVEIIQNAQILPVEEDEGEGLSSFALLQTPQKVFGRPNRHKYHRFGGTGSKSVEKPSKKARIPKSGMNSAKEVVPTETKMPPEREPAETVFPQVYKVVSGLGSSMFGSG
ncbi:hypothetical protein COCSADRAFT_195072 [Bipolaris sorokiniana ND90Pr]|uniref:Helicase C-terminal domain-containing protein n=1 Tax=Cochliobolus sativus (strain ND90Pr / ATCC 201652) TaxID=665912 RepID=M2TKK8_COCSN|nr:uncharacterized protein COCSADRAFT_195072 [Bipolaris sorokiniana ND90Pr]EMD69227.1 hypothetical protein COCSADRAFT_195072 [Bipolaris sorokiniana ND90Pr]